MFPELPAAALVINEPLSCRERHFENAPHAHLPCDWQSAFREAAWYHQGHRIHDARRKRQTKKWPLVAWRKISSRSFNSHSLPKGNPQGGGSLRLAQPLCDGEGSAPMGTFAAQQGRCLGEFGSQGFALIRRFQKFP